MRYKYFFALFFITTLILQKPNLVFASTPCVHVKNTSTTIQTFCTDTDTNPIQHAINFAHEHNYPIVTLDPGQFPIKTPILNTATTLYSPFNAGVGVYIPSNITVIGSRDPEQPTIIYVDASIAPIDVMIYVADHPTDLDATLHDTTVSYLELHGSTNGVRKSVVGLWAGQANKNITLSHLNIHDIGTGLIAGRYGQYNLDPATGNGKTFPFSGSPSSYLRISANHIHSFTGDGIAVMGGSYVEVDNNIIADAPTNSNAITGFVSVHHLWIRNNTISNTYVGIGLDGSFPIYFTSPPTTSIFTLQDQAGIGNETGFGYESLILNNTITGGTDGIRLWRQHHTNVVGNLVEHMTGTGISISESRDNYAGGNHIKNTSIGLDVYSTGRSLVGSRYNGIGMYTKNGAAIALGNNFVNTATGVRLLGVPDTLVSENTVVNNCFTNLVIDDRGVNNAIGSNLQGSCLSLPQLPDLAPLIKKRGDATGDILVNNLDYAIWKTNYSNNLIGTTYGDFNENGWIDGKDYVIWVTNYGL